MSFFLATISHSFMGTNIQTMGFLNNIFGKGSDEDSEKYESWKRWQGGPTPNFDELSELGQISSHFEWIFNPDRSIARKAANGIHQLLLRRKSTSHKGLYKSFRHIYLRPKDIHKIPRFSPEVNESLYCIASLNGNGYVREAALKRLAAQPSALSFPFLLYRLRDWVPVIREEAAKGIEKALKELPAPDLIYHHKTIAWMLKVARRDLSEIYHKIGDAIFAEEHIASLTASIPTFSNTERYFVYQNLISRGFMSLGQCAPLLKDKYFMVRLLLVRQGDVVEHPGLVKGLLNDKSRKVRQHAIQLLSPNHVSQLRPSLLELTCDPSSIVRETARNLLAKGEAIDFRSHYMAVLRPHPKAGAVLGLSEVGSQADLVHIRPLLNAAQARTRAAALIAIENLDSAEAKALGFEMLGDPSAVVKRMALAVICGEREGGDVEKLREIYRFGDPDTKRYVLKAMFAYGGWKMAGDLIEALEEPDPKLSHLAATLLARWYHYAVGLAIAQSAGDKAYVMEAYGNLNVEALDLPKDLQKILAQIPAIFR